jgi:putative copper resistance protein D
LWSVVSDTGAGRAWAVRPFALVAAIGVCQLRSAYPLLGASGLAAATLTWGGHAAANAGVFGLAHLAADVTHILAAGIWVGALVTFFRLAMHGGEAVGATATAPPPSPVSGPLSSRC